MNTQHPAELNPELAIIDGVIKTTSLKVAEHFGKQHKSVLRAIQNLDCSSEFRERNFAPTFEERENPKGGLPIKSPAYELTRDGFTFLAMGFTGKQAAQWKEAYILAFNRMESELHENPSKPTPVPQTYAAALRQLADETEAKETALAKIEADKPKVEFAEIVTEDSNTRCVRVWVKAMKHENNLTVGEQQVFKWLMDNRYIFKDSGGYLPYAKYEANGANYFTVVIDDINGKPRRQLKITGKGVVALTGKVVKAFAQPRNGLVLLQGAQA